jgi:molybdate/tungstate transport system substrate-binding protein
MRSSRSSSRSSRSAEDRKQRARSVPGRAPVAWKNGLRARAVLVVERGTDKVLAPRVVRLLERVRVDGSVRQAAAGLGLGYRHALAWIRLAEESLGRPLVVRQAGGVSGGGAGLTLDGLALVRAYRRIDQSLRQVVVRAEREIMGGLLAAVVACGTLVAFGACSGRDDVPRQPDSMRDARGPLVVYNAGSLARPLRAALDSFAAGRGVEIQQENAGSLETARKLTELHKIPDVIALADYEVFPRLLMPAQTSWYAQFARNRMVLAYTPRSRHASAIDGANWWRILLRPDVEVGRANPQLDPNGYRALLVLQLAEQHYRQPGLARRLLDRAPERNVRPKEADLVALLQAGELDYAWSYESLAQAANLSYVRLPHEIDLGTSADSARYAVAKVRVVGSSERDTIEFRGQPIVYGLSIPTRAPHPGLASQFVAFVLSDEGRRVLRAAKLDALEQPVLVGEGAPAAVARLTSPGPAR